MQFKHRVGEKPLKKFFEGLHPDYKKLLVKKLTMITMQLTPSIDTERIPTLEECFTFLGMCETRLAVTTEIESVAKAYMGNRFFSIKEITDIRELCKKQTGLIKKMIRGHLQQLTKETA